MGADGAVALEISGGEADVVIPPAVEAVDEAVGAVRSAAVLGSVRVFGGGDVEHCPSARRPVDPSRVRAAVHHR